MVTGATSSRSRPARSSSTVKGARYDGVSFARYQQSQLRVDQVFGEFYWQVHEGETVEAR